MAEEADRRVAEVEEEDDLPAAEAAVGLEVEGGVVAAVAVMAVAEAGAAAAVEEEEEEEA